MSSARVSAAPLAGLRSWQVLQLAEPLRSFLICVIVASAAAVGVEAAGLRWAPGQLAEFAAFLACGALAVEASRSIREVHGALSRDVQTVWYLAIAVTLPPLYAFAAPVLVAGYKLWRMPRAIVYRRVFSNATLSLGYGGASILFHSQRPTSVGLTHGTAAAAQWAVVVAVSGVAAWLVNHILVLVAIRLSEPGAGIRQMIGTRESLAADLGELSLAVSVSLLVAISPVLLAPALPSVVLYRRHLMHAQLFAEGRTDAETGLLNAVTWRREAAAEVARARRSHEPLALALARIDRFDDLDDAAGYAVAVKLLREVAAIVRETARDNGLIGRLGWQEFAILLPRTGRGEARKAGEQLRDRVAAESIPVDAGAQAGFIFRLTLCVGVAVLSDETGSLEDLVGAASTGLGQARSEGWSRVVVTAG